MTDFQPGDVVYADGASAILGDVVEVEAEDGSEAVTVEWRPTRTTELAEDLTRVSGSP